MYLMKLKRVPTAQCPVPSSAKTKETLVIFFISQGRNIGFYITKNLGKYFKGFDGKLFVLTAVLVFVQTTWLPCTYLSSDHIVIMYSSLFRPPEYHVLVFVQTTSFPFTCLLYLYRPLGYNVLVFVQTPTCLTSNRLCFEHFLRIL